MIKKTSRFNNQLAALALEHGKYSVEVLPRYRRSLSEGRLTPFTRGIWGAWTGKVEGSKKVSILQPTRPATLHGQLTPDY